MKRTRTRVIVAVVLVALVTTAIVVATSSHGPSALSRWATKYERPDAVRLDRDLHRLLGLHAPAARATVLAACTTGRIDVARATGHPVAPFRDVRATYAAILAGESALYANCMFSLQRHSTTDLKAMGAALPGIYQMQSVLVQLGHLHGVRLGI